MTEVLRAFQDRVIDPKKMQQFSEHVKEVIAAKIIVKPNNVEKLILKTNFEALCLVLQRHYSVHSTFDLNSSKFGIIPKFTNAVLSW